MLNRVGKRVIGKEMERDVRVAVLARVGKRADSEGGEARCNRGFESERAPGIHRGPFFCPSKLRRLAR